MLNAVSLDRVMVIDIETVPQFASFQEMPLCLQDLWEIKTQHQRGELQSPESFYERAGIMAEFGKIICISMGVFDIKKERCSLRVKSIYGDDEKVILNEFSMILNKQPNDFILCAHNGKEFDYPYLCRRFLINGLKIPRQMNLAGKKPWEVKHLDTMELWKFGDYKHYVSLDLLTVSLQIPTPKDDIDGSRISKVYYQEGDLERIVNYCQKDVISVAQILLRYKTLPLIQAENITFVE